MQSLRTPERALGRVAVKQGLCVGTLNERGARSGLSLYSSPDGQAGILCVGTLCERRKERPIAVYNPDDMAVRI